LVYTDLDLGTFWLSTQFNILWSRSTRRKAVAEHNSIQNQLCISIARKISLTRKNSMQLC